MHEYKERVGGCAECGNSPVHHLEAYLFSWIGMRIGSQRRTHDQIADRFFAVVEQLLVALARVLIPVGSALRVVRFGTDLSKAATYRSQVVWEEAARRGIEMQQLILLGFYSDLYRARIRDRWEYFLSLPIPPALGADRSWIDDKVSLKRVLAAADVPTPPVHSVSTIQEALDVFRALGGPVAVKPQVGSRGRHTTVPVHTEEELTRAFHCANQLCPRVAVERALKGSVCRGTVIGGTLRGFFQADAPRVVGDGVSSVRKLIERQNTSRHERVGEIVLTSEHEAYLARHGHTLNSVPAVGAVVQLTHRTGRLFGGRTRELYGKEHPKLRAYLESAAAALGVVIAGFDLIIQDPEADPDGQEWGIIEANSLPYIDLHYLPLEGVPTNVAAAVWDLWEPSVHSEQSVPAAAL